MRKILLALACLVIVYPSTLLAQKGGSLVGSLGIGLAAAQGDFASQDAGFAAASSGFGIEAELRYYLFGGFAIGGNVNYERFASSYESTQGRVSYNFSQMGGIAKMNLITISPGKMYIMGGAGVFTPKVHYYSEGNSFSQAGDERGTYYFGGIGLISKTSMKALYEFEARYNIATAKNDNQVLNYVKSDAWDFIYIGMKLSFSTKGMDQPPKY